MSEFGTIRYYDCGTRFDELPGIVFVRLGIHETMPPGVIHSGDSEYPYLFMYFHSPAQVVAADNSQAVPAQSQIMIWSPRETHCYGNPDSTWEHSWIILSGSGVGEMLERYVIPCGKLLSEESGTLFEHYLNLIYEKQIRQPKHDPEWNERMLDLFFYELSRCASRHDIIIPEKLVRAVKFMEQNLAKAINLDDAARVAGLSMTHFNVLFKQFYGDTPINYLIRLRMLKARRLLHHRYIPVKNVAIACGYRDPLYFSRYFRQYFGITPRDCQLEAARGTTSLLVSEEWNSRKE